VLEVRKLKKEATLAIEQVESAIFQNFEVEKIKNML
jgi:hypothetical protein